MAKENWQCVLYAYTAAASCQTLDVCTEPLKTLKVFSDSIISADRAAVGRITLTEYLEIVLGQILTALGVGVHLVNLLTQSPSYTIDLRTTCVSSTPENILENGRELRFRYRLIIKTIRSTAAYNVFVLSPFVEVELSVSFVLEHRLSP